MEAVVGNVAHENCRRVVELWMPRNKRLLAEE